jgi:bla regulator protein blaR1
LAFEIVSIRQNLSNPVPQPGGAQPFGPTADGYRMTGMPLALPIMTAFVPGTGRGMFMPDRIVGLPDWATKERYDIDAKVSGEDLAEWQKSMAQASMLPAMLQTMLADRCKLVTHREMKDQSVYLLTVGKGGIKFKETDPADTPPAGVTLPGGVIMVRSNNSLELYGTTMGFFATMLSGMGNAGPIEDRTGLMGRYNIVVKSIISVRSPSGPQSGGTEASDPSGTVFSAVGELGLKLEHSKAPVETLVIDHMERPTAN